MRKAKFLTPAEDVLSYEADDGRTVVCDVGTPEFAAALELGTPAPYVAPPPDLRTYTAAIDAQVEAVARGRSYNSAAHMASYVVSTVPQWAAEAAAFVSWRDDAWLIAFDLLRRVQAGEVPAPTVAELVAGLPAPNWPEG